MFLRNLIRKFNVNQCYIYSENYKEVIVYDVTRLRSMFSNLKTSKPARLLRTKLFILHQAWYQEISLSIRDFESLCCLFINET